MWVEKKKDKKEISHTNIAKDTPTLGPVKHKSHHDFSKNTKQAENAARRELEIKIKRY